ncbi:MAG: 3-oxoacyl-ACP reductase FabG [Chloroflexi bacterium]|nr:3-oxoacyl-ACP reductase FabG [Chloroflexota bacterium]
MYELKEKVALVTGASRGIGRAVALELGRHGASVVVNYHQNEAAAQEVVQELAKLGAKAAPVQANVADPEQAKALVQAAVERFGGLDVLVNNAGISRDRTIRRMSVEEWQEVLRTNLDSAFYCVSAAVSHIIDRGGGRIVNVSSIQGQAPNAGVANYASSKAGIIGFTKVAAVELARYNITVNAVCPGFVETDLIAGLSDEIKQQLVSRVPLGRFGRPEEVASLVRYIVTEGDYITGQCLNLNGGMYM